MAQNHLHSNIGYLESQMGHERSLTKSTICFPMAHLPSERNIKKNGVVKMNDIPLFFTTVHHQKNGKDQGNGNSSEHGDHDDAIVP